MFSFPFRDAGKLKTRSYEHFKHIYLAKQIVYNGSIGITNVYLVKQM